MADGWDSPPPAPVRCASGFVLADGRLARHARTAIPIIAAAQADLASFQETLAGFEHPACTLTLVDEATLVTRLAEAESRDLPDCSTESNSRPGSYLPLQIVGYKPLVAAAPIASSQRDTEAPGHHTQTGRGLTF